MKNQDWGNTLNKEILIIIKEIVHKGTVNAKKKTRMRLVLLVFLLSVLVVGWDFDVRAAESGKASPKYLNLRYDEDFSYLDDPSQVTTWADFYTFYADQDRDALYSAGGGTIRTPAGGGSHKIGHELDVTMKVDVDKHTTALAGWAHLWPGGFIRRTGTTDSPDLFYAQIEYKF